MPRPPNVPRLHADVLQAHHRSHRTRLARILLTLLCATALTLLAPPSPSYARPALGLPTPPGETWKVIQGYGCGSHNGWDRYSLDLVSADGATFGAPARAAADGTIWSWTAKSGTLIIAHGDGFYTMYTHLDRAVSTRLDSAVRRGEVIGYVGDRAAHGLPHLHFTAFTGKGLAARPRQSVPLSFDEGYDLPDVGGCNQHGGVRLVAGGQAATGVRFSSNAEPLRWYSADQRVEFVLPAGARGFSQAWDQPPPEGAPQFAGASAGYVQTAWAGEGLHTLHIRYWDAAGASALASFGPVGYDLTPPSAPAPIAPLRLAASSAGTIRWQPAADGGAGLAGYRVYLGADPAGVADTFSAAPELALPALPAGSYLLRVQPVDYAGNPGAWATLGSVEIAER